MTAIETAPTSAKPAIASPGDPFDWFFDLRNYELPTAWVRASVGAFRAMNTVADTLFYNVGELVRDLAAHDLIVDTMPPRADGQPQKKPSRIVSLDALTTPEGALLLIDTQTAPFVHCYDSVEKFLTSPYAETRAVEIVTITGVGSSAYGSAALGWQISRATKRPVLAIVPGYGMADMIQQGLGGWFGFGMHDWLQSKAWIQHGLSEAAPRAAEVGRNLTATSPETATKNGAPLFRYGSGSSDALHALLAERPGQVRMVVGHSKGALSIRNALRELPDAATAELAVVTLGCPIDHNAPGKKRQILGTLDGLGMMNSWSNAPTEWALAWHTTNLQFWLPMQAAQVPAEIAGAFAAIVEMVEEAVATPPPPPVAG